MTVLTGFHCIYNRIQVTRVEVIGVCIQALRRLVRIYYGTCTLTFCLNHQRWEEFPLKDKSLKQWQQLNWAELLIDVFIAQAESWVTPSPKQGLQLERRLPFVRTGGPDRCSYQENSSINQYYSARSVGNDGFSENFERRLLFHFQNNRSGWPALTFGKRPYSLEAELETGSLLCRMALCDCFGRRIWTQFPAQLRNRQ